MIGIAGCRKSPGVGPIDRFSFKFSSSAARILGLLNYAPESNAPIRRNLFQSRANGLSRIETSRGFAIVGSARGAPFPIECFQFYFPRADVSSSLPMLKQFRRLDVAENNVPFPHDNFLICNTHRAEYVSHTMTLYRNYLTLTEETTRVHVCEKNR